LTLRHSPFSARQTLVIRHRPHVRRLALSLAVAATVAVVAPSAWAQGPAATPATATVVQRDTATWSEYHGAVAARNSVQLIALITGRIRAVHAAAGQRVRKGQVLVELEPQDFEARLTAAESRLAQARASLDEARGQFERDQKLAATGFISEQGLERARARMLGTQAEEAEASANAREARTQLGYTVLRSPIDGIVTDKRVNPGDFSMPGLPAEVGYPAGRVLMTIYDPAALWFEVRVPERYAPHVAVGAPVRVSVPAAAVSLEARFAEIVPVVDDNSRTFTARVHLPAHPALKLGMFGRAQFTSGSRKAIEVPESAVIERGQLDAVFVHADNKAHLRMVRLGKRHQGQVEILSGLKPDERVILHPRANLRDGDAF
jgi:RND family efflux transporter MFP subunit